MDTFHAVCPAGTVVMMRGALYGRMRLGACVKTDFGFVGCSRDVLSLSHTRCSGRRECEISVPDNLFENEKPCNEEFKSYLQADFECLKVIGCEVPSKPQDGWLRLEGAGVTIGCYSTGHSWTLTCENGQWTGGATVCSTTEINSPELAQSRVASLFLSHGLSIGIIATVAVVVGVAILLFGLIILRRRRQRRVPMATLRTKPNGSQKARTWSQSETYDPSRKYNASQASSLGHEYAYIWDDLDQESRLARLHAAHGGDIRNDPTSQSAQYFELDSNTGLPGVVVSSNGECRYSGDIPVHGIPGQPMGDSGRSEQRKQITLDSLTQSRGGQL